MPPPARASSGALRAAGRSPGSAARPVRAGCGAPFGLRRAPALINFILYYFLIRRSERGPGRRPAARRRGSRARPSPSESAVVSRGSEGGARSPTASGPSAAAGPGPSSGGYTSAAAPERTRMGLSRAPARRRPVRALPGGAPGRRQRTPGPSARPRLASPPPPNGARPRALGLPKVPKWGSHWEPLAIGGAPHWLPQGGARALGLPKSRLKQDGRPAQTRARFYLLYPLLSVML